MQIPHFILMPRNSQYDSQLFMHRHWTMYTPCLDSDLRWRFTISNFLEIRKSHFEEILSLPTSNLTDAPARSRCFYSYWICQNSFNENQILEISSRPPCCTVSLFHSMHYTGSSILLKRGRSRTQAPGYYRESIELSWLPGKIIAYGRHLPESKSRDGSMGSTRGCNNMEIETQESYHPRRHQNNFAQ